MRLAANPYFPHELKAVTYFLPIEVEFAHPYGDIALEDVVEKTITEHFKDKA